MATPAVAQNSNRQSTAFVPSLTFRTFINQIIENVRNGLSNRRPWLELVDRSAISKPESLSEATLRIRKNYAYFRTNYHTLIAVAIGLSLISHPFTLFLLIALLAAWLFLYIFRPADQPLVHSGRVFSDFKILVGLIVSTVFIVLFTSVGSVLMSGLFVSAAVVCAHAAFRVPEDFYFEDQAAAAPAANRIFSLLTAAATNTAAPPPANATA